MIINNLEESIVELFNLFCNSDWKEKLKILLDLKKTLDVENSVMILSFLLEINSLQQIKVPLSSFHALNDTFNDLKICLSDMLPNECKHLLKELNEFELCEMREEEAKTFNENEYLIKIIMESLITFSAKEIEQLINIYFEPYAFEFVNQTNLFEYFLKKIDQSKFLGIKEREFIYKSLRKEEVEDLLSFLEKSKVKEEIIYSLYLYNPMVYDCLIKFIINFQISDLYDFLPKIDENYLLSKDVESSLLINVLLNRPLLFDKTVNFITKEVFEENKDEFIKLISNNFELLENKINLFPFSFLDHLKIADKHISFFSKIIDNFDYYSEIDNSELNQYLQKQSVEKIIEVFEVILKKQTERRKEFVNYFIQSTLLNSELKEYFLKNLDETYFYSLLPYHKREKQLEGISKYLTDKISLNYFLKVFSLGELFYFSHYINDIHQAKNAIQLCIDHPQFSENTLLFAIPKMETEKLPCLCMWSLIISYLKLKNRKLFIPIMIRFTKKEIWNNKQLLQGYYKMLELLSFEALEVLKAIDPDSVYLLLKNNRTILRTCREYFEKNDVSDYQMNILKDVVYSIK